MEREFVWAFVAVGEICFLGFLAGLARPKLPIAPVGASCLAGIGYFLLLSVTGVWTAACWDCDWPDTSTSIGFIFLMALLIVGGYTAVILAFIWIGAGLSVLFRLPSQANNDH